MAKRYEFKFGDLETDILEFFKQAGVPYAVTVRRALGEYYQNHHRNTKVSDLGKSKGVVEEEITREAI